MLPILLRNVLDQSLQQIIEHPEYALLPINRQRIYMVVGNLPNGELIRRWIDIYTAEFVLPIWETVYKHDKTPQTALNTAKQFLKGDVAVDAVELEIDKLWPLIERLGSNLDIQYYPNVDAGQTVAEATSRAIGIERWTLLNPLFNGFTETVSDEMLHVFLSDTAKWASFAYSGRVNHPFANKDKRMEFWTWWLTEAVSHAYYTIN